MRGTGAILIIGLVILVIKYVLQIAAIELKEVRQGECNKEQDKNVWQDFKVTDGELYWFNDNVEDIF